MQIKRCCRYEATDDPTSSPETEKLSCVALFNARPFWSHQRERFCQPEDHQKDLESHHHLPDNQSMSSLSCRIFLYRSAFVYAQKTRSKKWFSIPAEYFADLGRQIVGADRVLAEAAEKLDQAVIERVHCKWGKIQLWNPPLSCRARCCW